MVCHVKESDKILDNCSLIRFPNNTHNIIALRKFKPMRLDFLIFFFPTTAAEDIATTKYGLQKEKGILRLSYQSSCFYRPIWVVLMIMQKRGHSVPTRDRH